MTTFRWQNIPYDTQRMQYIRRIGDNEKRVGEVFREIQARQHPYDVLFRYNAVAFTSGAKQKFDTQHEAKAWVTACERME
jgi:hypothetical protein